MIHKHISKTSLKIITIKRSLVAVYFFSKCYVTLWLSLLNWKLIHVILATFCTLYYRGWP